MCFVLFYSCEFLRFRVLQILPTIYGMISRVNNTYFFLYIFPLFYHSRGIILSFFHVWCRLTSSGTYPRPNFSRVLLELCRRWNLETAERLDAVHINVYFGIPSVGKRKKKFAKWHFVYKMREIILSINENIYQPRICSVFLTSSDIIVTRLDYRNPCNLTYFSRHCSTEFIVLLRSLRNMIDFFYDDSIFFFLLLYSPMRKIFPQLILSFQLHRYGYMARSNHGRWNYFFLAAFKMVLSINWAAFGALSSSVQNVLLWVSWTEKILKKKVNRSR